MTDFELMGAALDEARKAAALGEVPVGAVVARNGQIVAAAHNTRETEKNALHHAELLAIDAACKALGGWRLWECELFVTLEPCPMCAGAILNSRIRRVVYGAADAKAGCCGSVTDLFALPFNHHRREYEETVKKWKLRGKVSSFHFLFSANCAILFNGILSKPI